MVDLHVHILPGMDDGSHSMEESLQMARLAAASGVRALAATPHCNILRPPANDDGQELRERLVAFRQELIREDIPLEVFIGMEVFAGENLPELLREKRLIPINEGRYLLLEFPFEEEGDWMTFLLKVVLEQGYIPLIAHPERYRRVQSNPNLAFRWVTMGCALQLNKGSLLGQFGKAAEKTAVQLLGHGLAACVASDAHHAKFRTPHLTQVEEYIKETCGEAAAKLLLLGNPVRILNSDKILLPNPRGFQKEWF